MIVVFDIDGVIRDVAGSYRKAIADTVEHFTQGSYRPTIGDIDILKSEGIWNNDWEASRELTARFYQAQNQKINLNYQEIVDFFQSRYRGEKWDGYITQEPLLLDKSYLEQLTAHKISWGFFSGATRGSAEYVLKKRLELSEPVLIAMGEAPDKPNPTGLLEVVKILEKQNPQGKLEPVIYLGDTVADMYTIVKARQSQPQRLWIGVGILPPHVQSNSENVEGYSIKLKQAGGSIVLNKVEQLTPAKIQELVATVREL